MRSNLTVMANTAGRTDKAVSAMGQASSCGYMSLNLTDTFHFDGGFLSKDDRHMREWADGSCQIVFHSLPFTDFFVFDGRFMSNFDRQKNGREWAEEGSCQSGVLI